METELSRLLVKHSPGDVTGQRLHDLDQERLPSSATAFLLDQTVTDWLEGNCSAVLWAYGPAASGKTFLSSALANHIKSTKTAPKTAVATYVFKGQLNVQRNVCDFDWPMNCIIRQLVPQLPASFDLLAKIVQQKDNDFWPWPEIGAAFDTVFLIFDGLDNCASSAFNDLLLYLSGKVFESLKFRIFATSRQKPQPDCSSKIAFLPVRASDDDLRAWVERKIGQDSPKIIAEAIKYLDGRFLPLPWTLEPSALLQLIRELRELRDAKTPVNKICEKIASAIEHTELGDLALHVMNLLENENYTWRTVTVTVLTEFLSHAGVQHASGRPYTEEEVIESQRIGFFRVGVVSRDLLVESSVREDLLPLLHAREISNDTITCALLKYLAQDAFKAGPCSSSADLARRFEQYPFLNHAAGTLPYHLDKSTSQEVIDEFVRFSSDKGSRDSFLQATESHWYHDAAQYGECELEEERWNVWSKGYGPIHLAASIGGSVAILNALIEKGNEFAAKTAFGETALHIAASNESQELAEALIRHGIDISAVDDNGDTALLFAVQYESPKVIEMLLRNGALAHGPPAAELLEVATESQLDETVNTLLRCEVITEAESKQYYENKDED